VKVLVADDDAIARRVLEGVLERAGFDVLCASDGERAWDLLQRADGPRLAILDWSMPRLDGIALCRRIRQAAELDYVWVVMVTARGSREDVLAGMEAGADDYISKPYDSEELRSRLSVGRRLLELQSTLHDKIDQLESALRHVSQLQGLLPICMHCKKIRDDQDVWHRLEAYIEQHSGVMFTHSLCRECLAVHYPGVVTEPEPV
jgi:DNA-binding response OmpR family regulator